MPISCNRKIRWESFIRVEKMTFLCSVLWCVVCYTVAVAYICQETLHFIQINVPPAPCFHHFTLLLETLWQFSKWRQHPDRVWSERNERHFTDDNNWYKCWQCNLKAGETFDKTGPQIALLTQGKTICIYLDVCKPVSVDKSLVAGD